MTQQELGEKVGIKFQQIQKYETGANRVSASRLWDISQVLEVPVTYFFDGLSQKPRTKSGTSIEIPMELANDRETMELVRSYYAIPQNQRKRLFDLAKVLSDVA